MSSWRELTFDQLKALTTHRLYSVYKLLQGSIGYGYYDSDTEGAQKAEFIKAELDNRGHIERKAQPEPGSTERSRNRQVGWWNSTSTMRPQRMDPTGPIKIAEDCIGKQVHKISKKPFKSKQVYNTVKGVTINPHTQLEAFAFEEDESIVDVHICKLREVNEDE